MKRSRFREEQVIGILKEHQAGATAADLCRKHGIGDATFYKWRSKCDGMEVSGAKKLKALAEQMMDVSTVKEMWGKNVWSLDRDAVLRPEPRLRNDTTKSGLLLWRALIRICINVHPSAQRRPI
ncbi:Mobile element protein [Candidatus Rhodobacter oscarellae]|uniref:Mobile element protein n=1 Tax=Candidatus Rhodobacter oscarellae TaxID=1675527 RepID=A0A0J9EFS5_9RHOB|nr:Mobile element protein [Candidatus Rhodobacter lobularis]